MADDPSIEPLDSNTNNQPDPPMEIIPIEETETIIPIQQTENMEVHHHPDLHHRPKKWKEYFLEFLMIFLAVTMGFFAESYREHLVEKTKEKEYLKSMIEDLKYDTSNYQHVITDIDILKPALDSSYTNVKEVTRFNYILLGKWQFAINSMGVEYRPGLTTIQQMKNSGNLRLVGNKEVAKRILEYESLVKGSLERANNNANAARAKVYAQEDASCDYSNFRKVDISANVNIADSLTYVGYNMKIVEKDPLKQNEFANSFINYKAINSDYRKKVIEAKEYATELIKLINEEYHFEK